jgi:hypothetical protein
MPRKSPYEKIREKARRAVLSDGAKARQEGRPRETNPYRPNEWLYNVWDNGWLEGASP